MHETLADYYTLTMFASLALLIYLESGRALRKAKASIAHRWGNNSLLFIVSTILYQLVFPFTCLIAAYQAELRGRGFSNVEGWQWFLVLILSIVMLDFLRWFWHYLCHRIPILWRIHRIHHTDPDLDVFTALRFHPIELIFAAALNASIIYLFGIPLIVVFIYDCLAITVNNFNHSNLNLGEKWERRIGRWIYTPRLHAIHHDAKSEKYLANLGGFLVCWDKIFGFFQFQSMTQARKQLCGLQSYSHKKHLTAGWMLINPFLKLSKDEILIETTKKR